METDRFCGETDLSFKVNWFLGKNCLLSWLLLCTSIGLMEKRLWCAYKEIYVCLLNFSSWIAFQSFQSFLDGCNGLHSSLYHKDKWHRILKIVVLKIKGSYIVLNHILAYATVDLYLEDQNICCMFMLQVLKRWQMSIAMWCPDFKQWSSLVSPVGALW